MVSNLPVAPMRLVVMTLLLMFGCLQPAAAGGQSVRQATPVFGERPPSTYVRPNLGRPVNTGTTIPNPAMGLELRLYTLSIEPGASMELPYPPNWTIAGFIGVTEISDAFGAASDAPAELDTLNSRPTVPGMTIGNGRDQTAVAWLFGIGAATDPDLATPPGVTLRRVGQLSIPESMAGRTVVMPLVVQAAGPIPQPIVGLPRGSADTRTYDDAASLGLLSVLGGSVSLTGADGQQSEALTRGQTTAMATSGVSVVGDARTAAEGLNLYVSLLVRPYAVAGGPPAAVMIGGTPAVQIPAATVPAREPAVTLSTVSPAETVASPATGPTPAVLTPVFDGAASSAAATSTIRQEAACDLDPVTPEQIAAIVADLQADPARASALFEDPFLHSLRPAAGTGQPADSETVAGIGATLDVLSACGQSQDVARGLAGFSPDYLALVVISIFDAEHPDVFTEVRPPSSAVPEGRVIVGAEVFADGRVGAQIYGEMGTSYTTFARNAAGLWQVDADDPTVDLTSDELPG